MGDKKVEAVAMGILNPEPITTPIIQGSCNQFDPKYEGQGISACTFICVEAARQFLQALNNHTQIDSELIDEIVDSGVEKYNQTGMVNQREANEHVSFEDIDISTTGLKRLDFKEEGGLIDNLYSGFVNNFDNLIAGAASKLQDPYVLLITKTPETVLVVCPRPNEYWFFDSHGKEGSKAYLEKFTDQMGIVNALKVKFPHIDDVENDYQHLLLNGFSAYTLQLEYP